VDGEGERGREEGRKDKRNGQTHRIRGEGVGGRERGRVLFFSPSPPPRG